MNVRRALIPMLVLVTAMLAPVAQAQRPDDRAVPRGPGAVVSAELSRSVRPDDRAGARGPGVYESAPSTAVRPDDRLGARGPGSFGSAPQSQTTRPDDRDGARGPGASTTGVVQSVSSGFDWGDAVIGGLAGIGTALMLTGLLFLVMTRRSKARIA